MNIGNIIGSVQLAQQHPQLIRPFSQHVVHRLAHPVSKHQHTHVHAPEQITIIVTDICNLRCKMCQYAYSDSPGYQLNQAGHMSLQLFAKIIDELDGFPILSFTGGEPLLHPHIGKFISQAKNRGLVTTLTTNGWMLSKRVEELCQAGLDVLVVSVDGPQEVHDTIRSGKSFSRLTSGIQLILQHEPRPIVYVNMTISNLNYDQLLVVYEQAKRWGVDGLNFNHLWMQTDEMITCSHQKFPDFEADEIAWQVQPEAVDIGTLADQLETIRRLNQFEPMLVTELPKLNRSQIADWYQHPAKFVKYRTTRCAWTRLKIWPDGRVKPCREWVAGNVAEQNLMEIWRNGAFTGLRNLLTEHGVMPICSRCCYMTHR
ncbi:MAG TPA: radical SAM protein [Chloroflexota bacterium]|nr:radical SAM protein [Chloroflexota bacterium]HUM68633.1 radical SAM protein [Chloroflexota bacterium]